MKGSLGINWSKKNGMENGGILSTMNFPTNRMEIFLLIEASCNLEPDKNENVITKQLRGLYKSDQRKNVKKIKGEQKEKELKKEKDA